MSKSLGNIERLEDLEKRGVSALSYRYFCFTASYRKPLTWSRDAIESADNSYKKLKNICLGLSDDGKINENFLDKFLERINDDLDMPGALAVLWEMVRGEEAKGKVGSIRKMDEVFGLGLLDVVKLDVPEEVLALVKEREIARKRKDFGRSDEIRDLILEKGFVVRDSGEKMILEKKS